MKYTLLTEKQREVLQIVEAYTRVNGTSPSLREILKTSKTIHSLRGVALQLDSLEAGGYISRNSDHKSIRIVGFNPQEDDIFVNIPFFTGTVQAGLPSFFEEFSDSTISVLLSATKGLRNVAALIVRGDSMIDAGIEDGDYAIITEQVNANSGDIVVAQIDSDITLKTFRIVHGHPILFPENKNFKPITDRFSIKGKLVNILKPQEIDSYRSRRENAKLDFV